MINTLAENNFVKKVYSEQLFEKYATFTKMMTFIKYSIIMCDSKI